MLTSILQVIFVIICLVLMGAILLQSGKGGGLGAGFNAGSASTEIFGGKGPGSLLAKSTVGLAAAFMALSLLLSYLASAPQSSLDLDDTEEAASANADPIIESGTLQVNPDGSPLGAKPDGDTGDVKDAPAKDAPAKDAPAKDAPETDAPTDAPETDAPADEKPADDKPAEEPALEDAPAKDAPSKDVEPKDAPAEDEAAAQP